MVELSLERPVKLMQVRSLPAPLNLILDCGAPSSIDMLAPQLTKKIESSLLNGNLMVPAGHPSIFSSDGNAMEAESLET